MCEKVRAESPYTVIHLGDFNAHNSNWWHGDTDNEAGKLLHDVFDDLGLTQLVNDPTHILNNSKSCTDLVLSDQPNIISECSVHPSLHTTCHHQINHVSSNVNNPLPPPYYRKIWHHDRQIVPASKQQCDATMMQRCENLIGKIILRGLMIQIDKLTF